MKDVVDAVSSSLEDLSVSRPVERLTWGIRVPTDASQTIYVWLDALLNYVTKAGYPWTPGSEHAGGWPADVQVIGKDIVRFHCIYWPAFLMALDIPLPKRILTHAHWTLGKQKMAKSTGNVVNPFFALDRFGVDTMRYYMLHDGGITNDADYDNKFIIERYKKGLQGGLGNLTSRIMRGKGWDVQRAVKGWSNLRESLQDTSHLNNPNTVNHLQLLLTFPEKVEQHMATLRPNLALKTIMETIYAANAFLQAASPWDAAKALKEGTVDDADVGTTQRNMDLTIFLCAETLRLSGIVLQPFMPGKAALLLDMLGVEENNRTWAYARVGMDTTYGVSKVDLGRGQMGALFPPLTSDS